MNIPSDSLAVDGVSNGDCAHLNCKIGFNEVRENVCSNQSPIISLPQIINGDSDADSGIVAVGPSSSRVGSTSSNDTEHDVNIISSYLTSSNPSSSAACKNSSANNTKNLIIQKVKFDGQLDKVDQSESWEQFRANYEKIQLLAEHSNHPVAKFASSVTSHSDCAQIQIESTEVTQKSVNLNESINSEKEPIVGHFQLGLPSISETIELNIHGEQRRSKFYHTDPKSHHDRHLPPKEIGKNHSWCAKSKNLISKLDLNDKKGLDKLPSNAEVNKLCAIDPLDTTDSMVCAFASFANVIQEENYSSLSNPSCFVPKYPLNSHESLQDHNYEAIFSFNQEKIKQDSEECKKAQHQLICTKSNNNKAFNFKSNPTSSAHRSKNEANYGLVNSKAKEAHNKVKFNLRDSSLKSSKRVQNESLIKRSDCSPCSGLKPDQIYPPNQSKSLSTTTTSSSNSSSTAISSSSSSSSSSSTTTSVPFASSFRVALTTSASGVPATVEYAVISKKNDNKIFSSLSESCLKSAANAQPALNSQRNEKFIQSCQNLDTNVLNHHQRCDLDGVDKIINNRWFVKKISGFRRYLFRNLTLDKFSKANGRKDNGNKLSLSQIDAASSRLNHLYNQNDEPNNDLNENNMNEKSWKSRISLKIKSGHQKFNLRAPKKKLKWQDELNDDNRNHLIDTNAVTTWGELLELNVDGTQLIQLKRLPGHGWGFYIAKGTVNNVKGIFVTRIRDDRIKKELMGLLEFGDQIIAVDGADVTDYSVTQVIQRMDKTEIALRIIPYMNRVY